MVGCYVRKLLADLLKRLGIHITPVTQSIAFGDQAHLTFTGAAIKLAEFPGAAFVCPLRCSSTSLLKTIADNAIGGLAGKHLHLGRNFILGSLAQAPTLTHILTLGILPNNQHVYIFCTLISKILASAGQ